MPVEVKNLTLWEWLKLLFLCSVLFPSWLLQKVIPLPKGHPWRAHQHYSLLEWTLRAGDFKLKISAGLCSAAGLAAVGVFNEIRGEAAPSYMPLLGLVFTIVVVYCCFSLYLDVERRWAMEAERDGHGSDNG